jgi:chitodextrinase
VNTGLATVATLSTLTAGATYSIYVVAYDSAGNESPRSNVITYSPPAVTKITLAKPTANSAQLQFRAAPGSQCRVEYTPTLKPVQWQALTTATADTNGVISVTDPLTGRPPTRFYRAVRL